MKKLLFLLLFITLICCNQKSENPLLPDNYGSFSVSKSLPDIKSVSEEWSQQNTLIYHVTGDPSGLHPTNANSTQWYEISNYIHSFLLNIDYKGQGIAEGVLSLPTVSADGMTYIYSLRKGYFWDDNTPVTMEDILFTIKANCCPLTNNPHAKSYWENIKEVLINSSQATQCTLMMKKQYILNESILVEVPVLQRSFYDKQNLLANFSVSDFANSLITPIQSKVITEWADEFNQEKYGRDPDYIHGLGSYQLSKWEQGQSLTLTRKKNHKQVLDTGLHQNAFPERIIFKINKDDVSQLLEFKSQVMDVSSGISIKNLLELSDDKNFTSSYHVDVMPTFNLVYIAMNEKPDGYKRNKIFDDINVRKAFAYITPREQMIQLSYKNFSSYCARLTGPVSPLKKEYNHLLKLIEYDNKKAQQLLDKTGWKDLNGDGIREKKIDDRTISLSVDLHILNTSSEWKNMATLLVNNCRLAGIQLNVISMDQKVLYEKARQHDFDLMLGVFSGSSLPEDYSQLWHTSSWTNQGSNYSGFGNVASDALIDSINITLNEPARIEMIKRLQQMIYDDQPMVFLYSPLRRFIVHKRFHGVELFSQRPGILLNNLKLGKLQSNAINP